MRKYIVLFGIYAAAITLIATADLYLGPNISEARGRVPPTHEARSSSRLQEVAAKTFCKTERKGRICFTSKKPQISADDEAIQLAVRMIILEALAAQR